MQTISAGLRSVVALAAVVLSAVSPALAETGRDLWLRYERIDDEAVRAACRRAVSAIVAPADSATGRVMTSELQRGLRGLLAAEIPLADAVVAPGALVVGTPGTSPAIAALGWAEALARLGDEGYLIRSTSISGRPATVIASRGEIGALYGVFHFLRLIQTRRPIQALDIAERPRLALRLLNHWDNLDGTIERGYAGASLWNWAELPDRVDPRVAEYARANASLGINGTVLNNVNARAESLSHDYLVKAAAIAAALRPYGSASTCPRTSRRRACSAACRPPIRSIPPSLAGGVRRRTRSTG